MFDRTKEIWKEFVRRDTEILIGAEVRYNILERQYIFKEALSIQNCSAPFILQYVLRIRMY